MCVLIYRPDERPQVSFLPARKNFIQAKYDFIDEMLSFGQFDIDSSFAAKSDGTPVKILDVGCGIGGTSRYSHPNPNNKSLRLIHYEPTDKAIDRTNNMNDSGI